MYYKDVKNPGSNPRKWNEFRCREVYLLALLGAKDKEIAEAINIDIMTLDQWKRTHPEFLAALRKGKYIADTKVVRAFYKTAIGYEYQEDQVVGGRGEAQVVRVTKYKGPNAWAANKWLSLRHPEKWSETHRVEITQTNININKFDFSGLTMEELLVLQKAGLQQAKKQLTENAGSN